MIIRATKWPNKRMPTHKGKVMVDTYRGALRVRAWPKPRGQAKTPAEKARQTKFAQIQRAYPWLAPAQVLWLRDQTENSPLMPRDVLTAMMYNRLMNFTLPNGKTLYPMPTYQDVSDALDAITQTEGETVVRGPNGWEGGVGGGGMTAEIIAQVNFGSPQNEVIFTGLAGYTMLWLYCHPLVNASNAALYFRWSYDDGVTFDSTMDRYRFMAFDNAEQNRDEWFLANFTSSGGIYAAAQISPILPDAPTFMRINHDDKQLVYDCQNPAPNAFKIYPSSGQFSSGSIILMGA